MYAVTMKRFAGLAVLGAGLAFAGCKSTPPLSATDAKAMIQAKYDQSTAAPVHIVVDDLGMRQGITAKYWDRTKMYPNRFWADFTLTDDGKKVVTIPGGGDVIQWRPDTAGDTHYSIDLATVAANHLKAFDVHDPQTEADGTRSVIFSEGVDLTGVPGPLQDIAHNPGNHLSTKRTAIFAVQNGAWALQSIT